MQQLEFVFFDKGSHIFFCKYGLLVNNDGLRLVEAMNNVLFNEDLKD